MREDDPFDSAGDATTGEAAGGARPGLWRHVSIWSGAGLALALIAGAGYWLWDLGTRETARVPIIAAVTGPIKTRPEAGDPPIRHGDIESYEIARAGEKRNDATGFAPETPAPTEEDIALRDLEDILGISAEDDPAAAPAPRPEPPADVAADPAEPSLGARAGESEVAVRNPAAPEPRADEPRADEPQAGTPTPPPGEGSDLAPAVSPLARSRPADLPQRMAAARAEAEGDSTRLAAAAAEAPYQLQLGAFRSEDQTRAEWKRIAANHPELLHNRALAIQSTQSGGETFYRLRVGPFTSLAEAASLCEALLARDQPCIPAENR